MCKSKKFVLTAASALMMCLTPSLFAQAKPSLSEQPIPKPIGDAVTTDSQGQVTTEVDSLKAMIKENTEKALSVVESVQGLSKTFSEQTHFIQAAHDELRKAPTDPDARRRLLKTLTGSLGALATETQKILDQREETLERALEAEQRIRAESVNFRNAAEKIDSTLPQRKTQLDQVKQMHDARKEEFAANPQNRELRQQLLADYRAEHSLDKQLHRDEQRSRWFTSAAKSFHQKADEIQAASDSLLDLYTSVEFVNEDCKNNAELLATIVTIESRLSVFGSGVTLSDLQTQVTELGKGTERITAEIKKGLEVFLQPAETSTGGPLPQADSAFDRWLKSRNKSTSLR